MKILITNTDVLNGGVAAMLQSLLRLLRRAFGDDTEFLVYVNRPEAASRLYPDVAFRRWLYLSWEDSLKIKLPWRVHRFVNKVRFDAGAYCVRRGLLSAARLLLTSEELRDLMEYSTADLIIANGGTTLVENYYLQPHIFDFNVTLFFSRPLIFFTQSLGPFLRRYNRLPLRRIFDRSALVMLRDRKSLDNLLALGVANANMYVTADAALALADADVIERAANDASPMGSSINVAISVREWKFFRTVSRTAGMDRYIEAFRALTAHLVKRYKAHVTYISSCQGIPECREDDSAIASSIVEALPDGIKESVMVDKDFHPPEELMSRIREYDLVIATRFHMVILALCVGVPALPVSYEFKTEELFAGLNQRDWVQDIEQISAGSLIRAADSFIQAIPRERKALFEAVERERVRAIESIELVKQAFERWAEAEPTCEAGVDEPRERGLSKTTVAGSLACRKTD